MLVSVQSNIHFPNSPPPVFGRGRAERQPASQASDGHGIYLYSPSPPGLDCN